MERAALEARFYRLAAKNPVLAGMMPGLLDYDEDAALLILEDPAPAKNLADCYERTSSLETPQLRELARYPSTLHQMAIPSHERHFFRNEAIRKLNYEHIFDVPLRTDGALSEMLERITPGLDGVGESFRHDREFGETVEALGRRYLEHDGGSLIHRDLFPEACFVPTPVLYELSTRNFASAATRIRHWRLLRTLAAFLPGGRYSLFLVAGGP